MLHVGGARCSQEVTACFTSASFKCFANHVLLKRVQEIEITGHEIGTAGRPIYNFPAVGPSAVTTPVGGVGPQ